MRIIVNGEPVTMAAPSTVADLITHYHLGGSASAVEVNRELVPRRQHAELALADGDEVEIVTLVGGG